MTVLNIAAIGLMTGILGTGLGGLLVLALGKPRPATLSGILGFAGGIMVAIVFADLLPEALEVGGLWPAVGGILAGVLFIMALDLVLPHTHLFESGDPGSRFIRAGLVLGLGVALHNLPEGIAIGTGYMASPELGLTLAILIGIHNVPEGMALSVPLYAGGVNGGKIVLAAGMAGVPLGVGAYFGAAVGNVSDVLLALGLGFAAGAMLYIIFHELVPGAHRMCRGYSASVGIMTGITVGLILSTML